MTKTSMRPQHDWRLPCRSPGQDLIDHLFPSPADQRRFPHLLSVFPAFFYPNVPSPLLGRSLFRYRLILRMIWKK